MHMASMHETFFVLQEFEGPVYRKLRKAEARIIGPPVVFWCQRNDEVFVCRNNYRFMVMKYVDARLLHWCNFLWMCCLYDNFTVFHDVRDVFMHTVSFVVCFDVVAVWIHRQL